MHFVARSMTATQILYTSTTPPICEYRNGTCIKTITNLITIGSLQIERKPSSATTPAGSPLQTRRIGSIFLVRPPSGRTIMTTRGLALAYLLWRKPRYTSGHLRLPYWRRRSLRILSFCYLVAMSLLWSRRTMMRWWCRVCRIWPIKSFNYCYNCWLSIFFVHIIYESNTIILS